MCQHQAGTFRRQQYGSPRKSRLTIPCQDGTLLLYDVSSSYDTGRQSDLVKHGYSRDGKPAVRKERERCTEYGLPVQSLRCLLRDLATICRNTVRWRNSSATFECVTLPTDSQRRALELLGVSLEAPK